MGGSGPHEGNVLVDGMPVCGYGWDLKDAWVVCKELGFPSVVKYTSNSKFGRINDLFRMRYVACEGTERLLSECPYTKNGYCSSYSVAGVICSSEYIGKHKCHCFINNIFPVKAALKETFCAVIQPVNL